MDLIKNLSKDFADDMRKLLNFWPRKVIVTDSNTGGAKNNGIYCKFIYINNFILNNYILNIVFVEFQITLKPAQHQKWVIQHHLNLAI